MPWAVQTLDCIVLSIIPEPIPHFTLVLPDNVGRGVAYTQGDIKAGIWPISDDTVASNGGSGVGGVAINVQHYAVPVPPDAGGRGALRMTDESHRDVARSAVIHWSPESGWSWKQTELTTGLTN